MNKDIIISILILTLFGLGAYFVIKNAPDRRYDMNNNIEQVENNNTDQSQAEFDFINEDGSIDMPEMVLLKEGEGELVSKEGDTLGVLYVGYFEDGTVFDSNVESGNLFEFVLGGGQVITGWDIGLGGMKIGEIRRLTLPPAFAYGNQAVGPIPANSTLIFDVELKSIN